MGSFWGEYLPNWIAALCSLLAVAAVYFAWQSLRSDEHRALRAQAEGLSAWWAIRANPGGKDEWGIQVHNATNTTFHHIKVAAMGGQHPDASNPFLVRVLPPGVCFVKAGRANDSLAWEIAPIRTAAEVVPVMYSSKHAVKAITFQDASGLHWTWNLEKGLREATNTPT